MVSQMLTHTAEEWNALIEGAGNVEAVADLRAKEAIVVAYMKNNWGVDMATFQAKVVAAIEAAAQN